MVKSLKNVSFLTFFLLILIQTSNLHPNNFTEKFDNFYTVEQGKIYRSKQLDAKKFELYIKKYGIKTLVNLRGENPGKKWWEKEKKAASKNNVQFYNISMNAKKLPSKENVLKLLSIYDNAPKPILIHCQAGANRTGEAAALWKIYKQGTTKEEALKQLAIKYGHFSSKNGAKNFFIKIWQGKNWVKKYYDPKNYPLYN